MRFRPALTRTRSRRLGSGWRTASDFAGSPISRSVTTSISSYPRSWTTRYFELGYEKIDPVLRRARKERQVFNWTVR